MSLGAAVFIMLVYIDVVESTMCAPCFDPVTGDYVGPTCAPLPVDSTCEQVYRHCSCCLECAQGLGDVCHQMTTP